MQLFEIGFNENCIAAKKLDFHYYRWIFLILCVF